MALLLLTASSAAPSDYFRTPDRPLGQDFSPFIVATLQNFDLLVRHHLPLSASQPYRDTQQYIAQHGYRAEALLDRLS